MLIKRVELRISWTSYVSTLANGVYWVSGWRITSKSAFAKLQQGQFVVSAWLPFAEPVSQDVIQSLAPFYKEVTQASNLTLLQSEILN